MSAADIHELAEEEAELDSLDASHTDEDGPESDPFDETDPVAAEWAARRLRSARLRVAQHRQWHARMVARDDAWLEGQIAADLDPGFRVTEASIARAIAGHARDDLEALITDNTDGYWESPPIGERGVLETGLVWPTPKGEAA